MRNKIIGLLIGFAVTVNIITCLIGFTGSKILLKPKSVLEAPLLQNIAAFIEWVAGGGTWWGGGTRPRPDSSGN